MRGLASSEIARTASAPKLPTVAESGLPGFDVTSWYALSFPAGTPAPIVEKTIDALRELLATDSVRAQIAKVSALVKSSTLDELRKHIVSEIDRWKAVREKAGIAQQ